MKFIALKTNDGQETGKISFYCRVLEVTRQGFHDYLENRDKPWKHEDLAAKMMEIIAEDEWNDTYGRERMHKALTVKYPEIVLQPRLKKRGLHYRTAEVHDLAIFYELLE